MKICLICDSISGGFGSFIENTSSSLFDNGHSVALFCLSNVPKLFCHRAKHIYWSGSKAIKTNKAFRWLGRWKRVCFLLSRKTRRDKLAWNVFNSQLSSARCVLGLTDVIDLSEFDCVIAASELLCNYFLANCVTAKRKIGFVHPDYIAARFNRTIDALFFAKLDGLCAVSKAGSRSLVRAFPKMRRKISWCHPPMPVRDIQNKQFAFAPAPFPTGPINLVTVCRLDNSSKALDRLVLIAGKLRDASLSFCWRIIGDGLYRNELEQKIEQLNLSKQVLLLGHFSNPLPYVAASDLFVLQSYYEGYPISVCEALILNTPVLVTNYPSANEQVTSKTEGLVVKNSFNSIYSALYHLIRHPSEIVTLKNNLLKQNKERFETVDKLVKICGGI